MSQSTLSIIGTLWNLKGFSLSAVQPTMYDQLVLQRTGIEVLLLLRSTTVSHHRLVTVSKVLVKMTWYWHSFVQNWEALLHIVSLESAMQIYYYCWYRNGLHSAVWKHYVVRITYLHYDISVVRHAVNSTNFTLLAIWYSCSFCSLYIMHRVNLTFLFDDEIVPNFVMNSGFSP